MPRLSLLRTAWLAAIACAVSFPAVAGSVTGRVDLREKGGRAAKDVSDVIVYLDGVKREPRPMRVSVSMKDKTFLPHVTAVGVGSTVEFPNLDRIFHNAFSVSGPNRFDLDLYKKPKSASWTFKHPGVVRVYCNIHPQMSAIVLVRDNPCFVRAAVSGAFTLDDVPAGRYELHAWHERGGETSVAVNVPADGSVRAPALSLDAAGFKHAPHLNKYGKAYPAPGRY